MAARTANARGLLKLEATEAKRMEIELKRRGWGAVLRWVFLLGLVVLLVARLVEHRAHRAAVGIKNVNRPNASPPPGSR